MDQTISSYDENNTRLFYLIWRNIYLRKKILTDCLFFKNHRKTKVMAQPHKFYRHKFWDYFTDIQLNEIDETTKYPMFLESITFGEQFKYISNEVLIKMFTDNYYHLKTIETSYYFNQCIFTVMSSIPNSITSISLNGMFNRPLPISLSSNKNLKKLSFDDRFNQELYNLPIGLEHLSLNQSQQGKFATLYKYCLPSFDLSFLKSLTCLELGNGFNNPLLINSLNHNGSLLKTIKFGNSFNHQLSKGIIPDGVESIHITNMNYPTVYQESIHLPNSLKYLRVAFYSNELSSNIPNTLHTLVFKKINVDEFHLKKLPPNIERLEFEDPDFICKLPELPSSLTQLVLSKKHTSSDYYQSLKLLRPKPIIYNPYSQ